MARFQVTQRWAKLFTCLFFLGLLALGLYTSMDYGQPWDEPWEQDILRMNLNEYSAYFQIKTHLPLVSDIEKPLSGRISDSIERDHGLSAYYPAFLLVTAGGLSADTRMVLWHMVTWLWWMAGAVALYCIARRIRLSRLMSCAVVLFFALSPQLFAQGHYNNKDMVLLSALLLTLWLMLRLVERPVVWRALLFALVGAVSANTKLLGFFLYGACGLFAFLRLRAGNRMNKAAWLAAAAALVGYFAFWVLLTPAMWADPLKYLRYMVDNSLDFGRWSNYVLFRGGVYGYQHEALPFYYLPYMILVTTPLWLLVLIGIGQLFAIRKFVRERRGMFQSQTSWLLLLCTGLWLIPMAFQMASGSVIYNGWRHYFFLFAPMLILAAYGLQQTMAILRQWRNGVIANPFAALLALLMGATGVGMIRNHPYQYAYYNVLLQGKQITEYMELDYWNVSVVDTLKTLLKKTEGGVTVTGVDLWAQTGLRYAYDVLPEALQSRLTVLTQNDPDAMYYLANPTYVHFSGWQSEGMALSVQTMSYGWPICEIYTAEDLD